MDKNEAELIRIAEDNYDALFRFCRGRVRTNEDAYDIVQEVFKDLIEAYPKLRNKNAGRKWLHTTAHNIIVDYYKAIAKEAENRTLDNTSDEELGLFYEMTDQISEEQIELLKQETLSLLSDAEKKLYHEAIVKRSKPEDLASEYAITIDAMYKRIERLKIKITQIAKQLANN